MSESWRTALERLTAIADRRDLTTAEETQIRDAYRKRANEIKRRVSGPLCASCGHPTWAHSPGCMPISSDTGDAA